MALHGVTFIFWMSGYCEFKTMFTELICCEFSFVWLTQGEIIFNIDEIDGYYKTIFTGNE